MGIKMDRNELSVVKRNHKANLFIMQILFVVLLVFNGVVDNQLYSWALVLFAGVLMIVFPSEIILIFCVLTDSIQSYFLITPTLSYSRILTIMYIASVLLHKNGRIKIQKRWGVFILFGAYHLLSSFWSITGNFTDPISFCIGIVMILIMMSQELENKENFYSLMNFVSCFFIVFISIMTIAKGGFSSSQVIFDERLNANTICSAIVLFGTIVYSEILNRNLYSVKFFNYLSIILSVITILLVGSRTSLIAYIIVILILPIINKNISLIKLLRNPILIISGSLLILVFFSVFYLMFKNNSDIFERFTFSGDSIVSVDRRVYIWEALWEEVIPRNLWLGVGYGINNVIVAVSPYVDYAYHSHNMFFAILSETGIIGLLLYIVIFVITIKHIKNNYCYGATMTTGMLLAGFFMGIGEEVINRRWFWLAIGFAYLLTSKKNETKI